MSSSLFNTPDEFKRLYRTFTDENLIEIVTVEKENYQPQAVQAAREVLSERGIAWRETEEHQPDEIDINLEIKQRLDSGESVEAVLIDLRERGISPSDLVQKKAHKMGQDNCCTDNYQDYFLCVQV